MAAKNENKKVGQGCKSGHYREGQTNPLPRC